MKALFGGCLGLLLLTCPPTQAQHSVNAETQSYLDLASQQLLQRRAGDPPFRLKSTFEATAPDEGDKQPIPQQGTYEETWMSPSQWRRDITVSGQKVSFGRNNAQLWQTLPPENVPGAAYAIMQCILPTISFPGLHPLITGRKDRSEMKLSRARIGTVELDRIGDSDHEPSHGKRNALEQAYYFVPESHLLLSIALGTNLIEFKKTAVFAGKKVLMSGTAVSLFLPKVDFSIDSLESAPDTPDALFAPPQGSEILQASPNADTPFRGAHCVQCPQPIYPAIARSTHAAGTVEAAASVNAGGHVKDVRVISGPPMPRQAVIDGLRSWTLDPASRDGIAVPVEIIIETTFTIGR
jgi:hypothetical protein